MSRKRWSAQTEITPELVQNREKRKWQTTFRRYVIEQSLCPAYAPYFGLDIRNLRAWFESQFTSGIDWENFGSAWQFEHIIPLAYFDHEKEEDLRLCWNFLNLRVASAPEAAQKHRGIHILAARRYFDELYVRSGYPMAKKLSERVTKLELAEDLSTEPQQKLLSGLREHLAHLEKYTEFEFELLNSGKTMEEIRKEVALLNMNNPS